MIAVRIAGRLGRGGGPILFFSPFRRFESPVLQIEEGDHAHKSVAMQAAPGSPFEVIEAKFLLELLMGLLAEPPRLDGGGEDFQRRLGRQVREVVLVLACRTALAHEPDLLLAWEVLVRPFSSAGRGAVRDANPHRRERGSERALGTTPPCDGPPSLKSEHLVRRNRPDVWDGPLARTSARRHGPGEPDLDCEGSRQPTSGRAARARAGSRCCCRMRHRRARRQSGPQHPTANRARREQSRTWTCAAAPAPAHLPWPGGRDPRSRPPADRAAARAAPAPPDERALATPGSGSSPACPARSHIAAPPQPNACPSSAAPCRQ